MESRQWLDVRQDEVEMKRRVRTVLISLKLLWSFAEARFPVARPEAGRWLVLCVAGAQEKYFTMYVHVHTLLL